jgi:hypothetical protein
VNGAVHNPDTYREYCRIEAVTGYSFRKDFWLFDVKPELLPLDIHSGTHHRDSGAACGAGWQVWQLSSFQKVTGLGSAQ